MRRLGDATPELFFLFVYSRCAGISDLGELSSTSAHRPSLMSALQWAPQWWTWCKSDEPSLVLSKETRARAQLKMKLTQPMKGRISPLSSVCVDGSMDSWKWTQRRALKDWQCSINTGSSCWSGTETKFLAMAPVLALTVDMAVATAIDIDNE